MAALTDEQSGEVALKKARLEQDEQEGDNSQKKSSLGRTSSPQSSTSAPSTPQSATQGTASDQESSDSTPTSPSGNLSKEKDSSADGRKERIEGRVCLGADHSFKRDHTKLHILLAVTGSVATIKIADLVSEILRQSPTNRALIRIVSTESAANFFDSESFGFPVYRDRDEWDMWKGRGDPILHIELRRWADILVIAPLDANTLAKIANGICDNLVTCVVRAWDPNKPLFFCPAMNSYMLEHPLTFKHLDVLKNLLNYREIPCVEKELMCGDKGYGAMAPIQMIASVVAGEVKKRFAIISRS